MSPRRSEITPAIAKNVRRSAGMSVAPSLGMLKRLCTMIGVALFFAGCAATDGTEDPTDDDDDGDYGTNEDAISIAGRWKIPADVKAAGGRVVFAYDSAPAWNSRQCAGGLRSGAARLGGELSADFDPQILRIEGYACRRNTANTSRMSVHGTGRALDIFIPRVRGAADNTKGDAVANHLVDNAQTLGIQLVIWDRTRWMVGRGEGAYGGPNPHTDHIHAELTEESAR